MVEQAVDLYVWGKRFLETASGIDRDALHILVGIPLQLAFAAISGRSLRNWSPLLFIVSVALANETFDYLAQPWPDSAQQFGEAAKDLVLTIALPITLFAAARLRPRWLAGTKARPEMMAETSANEEWQEDVSRG